MREAPVPLDPADPDSPTVPKFTVRLWRTKTTTAEDDARVVVMRRAATALLDWLALAKIDTGTVVRHIDRWGRLGTMALDPQSVPWGRSAHRSDPRLKAGTRCPAFRQLNPSLKHVLTQPPPIVDPRTRWFNAAMSHKIFRMIRLLEANKFHLELSRHRPDNLMITATLVGERIEIDVFEDGHIEYSRFCGNEDAKDDVSRLEALLREHGQE